MVSRLLSFSSLPAAVSGLDKIDVRERSVPAVRLPNEVVATSVRWLEVMHPKAREILFNWEDLSMYTNYSAAFWSGVYVFFIDGVDRPHVPPGTPTNEPLWFVCLPGVNHPVEIEPAAAYVELSREDKKVLRVVDAGVLAENFMAVVRHATLLYASACSSANFRPPFSPN